jgi:hypothetical protein
MAVENSLLLRRKKAIMGITLTYLYLEFYNMTGHIMGEYIFLKSNKYLLYKCITIA